MDSLSVRRFVFSCLTASLLALAPACSSEPVPAPTTVVDTPVAPADSAAPTARIEPAAHGSVSQPVAKAPRKACSKPSTLMEGASAWKALIAPGACWSLENANYVQLNPDDTIIIEGFEPRRIGDAEVVKLRYTRVTPEGETPVGERDDLPLQVAVGKSGIWILDAQLDEQAIAKALKKPPTYADPPVEVKPSRANGWRDLHRLKSAKGPMVCFGHDQPRGNECEDTCEGMVCVSPTAGVVLLEGTASPNFETYMQPGWSPTP